ncbi:MAG TPA: sugar transferase [Solirubrobacterales bacterium]|nr:sugar transferase [Solirubrobacterales bacterium]
MTTKTVEGRTAEVDLATLLRTETPRVSDLAIRVLDVLVAASMLIVLSPLLVLAALLIKLGSPGPVIFWQRRLGKDLKPFSVAKFRTMYTGSPPDAHRVHVERMICEEPPGDGKPVPMMKLEKDPRVTKVGGFLRRSSIDELPQLWNVLRGEMSLVGPRPPIQYEVDKYPVRAYRRFAVRPGITGLWQVRGRSLTSFPEMIALDVEYVDRRSLLLNLKILVLTVPTVLHGKGAR